MELKPCTGTPRVWPSPCSVQTVAAAIKARQNLKNGDYTMAIEKKSLISSRTAAKKAVVARESANQVTTGPTKAAPLKHAALKHAPLKHAALRHAPLKHAPLKHAPLKHAPLKHAPMKPIV
jgi:uncharacterized protein YjbI with pentapeptide repeats